MVGFGVGRLGRGVLVGVTGFTEGVLVLPGCFQALDRAVWHVFAGFWVGVGVDFCRGWWACNVF